MAEQEPGVIITMKDIYVMLTKLDTVADQTLTHLQLIDQRNTNADGLHKDLFDRIRGLETQWYRLLIALGTSGCAFVLSIADFVTRHH